MGKEIKVTLDQWRALIAVIEHGGYAKAAEALGKSQSTVSYAVSQLEQALNVAVFRLEGRKANATAAGKALYQRAKHLLAEAGSLEGAAQRLGDKIEPEIGLAADLLVPSMQWLQCLDEFAKAFPATRVDVLESALSGTEDALVQKQVDLAITARVPAGFMGDYLCSVSMFGVAAPQHPLHHLGRCVTQEDLRHHRQLIVRDTGVHRRYNAGWLEAEQRWTFAHLTTSLLAVKQGLGFAWMPEGYIGQALARGELKRLPIAEGGERKVPLYLVLSDQDIAGPATRALAEILRRNIRD
ncbi:LysR family transcriptional regulator [Gilvimarinus sp. SDUM040013]|uniref:LysR family transcriptional regulator n=1 Tax=Gilvimarinus gilvus TaxID=3058038 RepID=A0ABU4RYV1_9GAMM|nr:LysR family transcriptional regulator [Gilvimarinus sp. SDUM040013]MDO3385752.1 LysR family transcriptional regulator [Gilvimarinus sp. SDUM040013]MDX6849392.1 LysR family transcriptional regulator [Gilvimarinus sp. SDUM040013]